MSQGIAQNITTPVGRLVQGSLYKANTTDAEGKPLVVKSGPNIGQPRADFYFALAIPKGAEQHWAYTDWGAKIWEVGHKFMPSAGQNPKFAWKVTDGDSQIPDAKNKRPCDREGFPGHWILRLSSGFAPRIFRQDAPGQFVQMSEQDAIKLGYYVQVQLTVDANGSTQQPGVFLNHNMVCFSAYGPEIVVGPDAASAGFGASPLPAGASAVPLGAASLPTPGVPGAPAPAPLVPGMPMPGAPVPGVPGAPLAAPVGSVPMPGAPAPVVAAPTPIAPNPAIMQVPAGVPAPAVPAPAPAAPVGPQYAMTAKAGGATREQFLNAGQGWTDTLLIQEGYMVQTA